MKKTLLLFTLFIGFMGTAQSVVQTVNSGSLITSSSSVSVGEIIIVPSSTAQSNSGILGILTQVNQQNLEVTEFELSKKVTVYPNPTVAKLYFASSQNLNQEKISIFNATGQFITEATIDSENSLDLSELSAGIYLVQFSNKELKSIKIIKH
jgi:hypothetical protein